MQIEFLTAQGIEKALRRLMAQYEEFYWAVAWGSAVPLSRTLLKHKAKFRSVTFGLAFNQTDPDLINDLVDVRNAYVMTRVPGGTYHPKLYCFRSGDEMAAIVGSANFTNGGVNKNQEAAVLLIGQHKDKVFRDLMSFIRDYTGEREPVKQEIADAYRLSCKRNSRFNKPPRDPDLTSVKAAQRKISSPLVNMTWPDYVNEIRASADHDVEESLELLRLAQKWFASVASFADLEIFRRKAIAGLPLNSVDRRQIRDDFSEEEDDLLVLDWGWFGSMRGMGDFANRIRENDKFMARAIDSIPPREEVTEEHYKQFVADFFRAFQHSGRTGGVPTASRLLAMKRPDTFLCVCGPNIRQVSQAMGFAASTLTLHNYWERVVETIRISDWHRAKRPLRRNAALWDSRAAMLDAIYYRPKA